MHLSQFNFEKYIYKKPYQIAINRFLPMRPVSLLQLSLLERVRNMEGAGIESAILVTR